MSQVVIITGASSGIGRATAIEFAKRGARLVLGSRREGTAASLMKELGEERAVFRPTDVTSKRDLQALVELAVERFGRLDIAINNAALEAKAPIADFDEEMYGHVFDTNVKGVFLAMAAEIAAMRRTGGGSIVNVGATSGSRGTPNMSIYAASKHAVEGLTRSAALELAKEGIRVNVVAPGPTLTPMLDRVTGGNTDLLASRVPMGRGVRGGGGARHRMGGLARRFVRNRCDPSRQWWNVRDLIGAPMRSRLGGLAAAEVSLEPYGLSGRCRSADG